MEAARAASSFAAFAPKFVVSSAPLLAWPTLLQLTILSRSGISDGEGRKRGQLLPPANKHVKPDLELDNGQLPEHLPFLAPAVFANSAYRRVYK